MKLNVRGTFRIEGEPTYLRMPFFVLRSHLSGIRMIINNISNAIWDLPKPIRRVCFVQVFAFMGWFPFLFYRFVYLNLVYWPPTNVLPAQPRVGKSWRRK